MAERRMFNKQITRSDAFLDMPRSARLLYYDLNLDADDDGFVKAPKSIVRQTEASQDDLNVLVEKAFVIPFESGVIAIKHWRMHNLLRKDRYKPTEYIKEKSLLYLKDNNSYTLDSSKGKKLTSVVGGAPVQEDKYGFSVMTDEELVAWGENGTTPDDPEFYEKLTAYSEEVKRRHGNGWNGKIVNDGSSVGRLMSHEEVMTSMCVSERLKPKVRSFLRACYANGHLITNDHLSDILYTLDRQYSDDGEREEALDKAIRGGYTDIKRYEL